MLLTDSGEFASCHGINSMSVYRVESEGNILIDAVTLRTVLVYTYIYSLNPVCRRAIADRLTIIMPPWLHAGDPPLQSSVRVVSAS